MIRGIVVALAAVVLALLAGPAAAYAHQGDPNYRSEFARVTPSTPGLTVTVVNYDDSFELRNRTGKTVVVLGYRNEPYARVLADGTVQINRASAATYQNDERFGGGPPPRGVRTGGAPDWQTQDRTGRFTWHDHRMHWMSRSRPPAVTDEQRRTKIFDYRIPLDVGGRPTYIKGTLWWVGPQEPPVPTWAIVTIVLLALAGGIALLWRRRSTPASR